MKTIKIFLLIGALVTSVSAIAAQSTAIQNNFTSSPTGTTAPTGTTTTVSSPQTFPTSDAPTAPTTTTTTNATITNNWAEPASAIPYNQQINVTGSTSTNNPLLSTDPQFNVMDVKVTASGGCEVRKNGTVIMSGGFSGSPCQKLYGKTSETASSGTSGTLPLEYQPRNLDVSFDSGQLMSY